ncbi:MULTISPECIES: uroporphyrinogen decarboxylase family protein [unclassified Paenibacillus]|uniref:uroporphyrinogen decarboxylase family protein n=1 Tax=unclassified Paenibacillus TaxID=185978 RepID=UPI00362B907C
MDKKTRVLNALNKQAVDKVPVGFWFHFSGEEAKGEACIEAHVQHYKDSDIDFIKIMCDGYFVFPINAEIIEAADWRKLKPLGKDHPYIKEQVERAKGISDRVNGECCIFYNVFAPFSCIRFGTSDELVMRHLKEDPEAVMYALDVIAQDQAMLAELIITEGQCTGAYYCLQGGEMDRFTYDEYRKWITPSDKYVLDHANKFSDNNMLHLCGWAGIKNRLECWRDYPAKAFNWAIYVEELGLKEGMEFFGGKAVLGGFDNTKEGLLYSGTKADVDQFTANLIEETGTTGVILGADCSLSGDIDRQRIKWVVEAAKAAQ